MPVPYESAQIGWVTESRALPSPRLDLRPGVSETAVLLIAQREVEAADLASVLSRLKVFLATREDPWLFRNPPRDGRLLGRVCRRRPAPHAGRPDRLQPGNPATLALFGQEWFDAAQAKGPLDNPAYRQALATGRRYARTCGIDARQRKHRLDAIIAPTGGPAWLIDPVNGDGNGGGCGAHSATLPAAVAGYPHVTVPMGLVSGLPVGLSFFGGAWQDAKLLALALHCEQATRLCAHRRTFAPSAPDRPSARVTEAVGSRPCRWDDLHSPWLFGPRESGKAAG